MFFGLQRCGFPCSCAIPSVRLVASAVESQHCREFGAEGLKMYLALDWTFHNLPSFSAQHYY